MRTSLDSLTPRPRSQAPAAPLRVPERHETPPQAKKPQKQLKKARTKSPRPIEINISLPEKIILPKLPKIPKLSLRKVLSSLKRIPRKVYLFGGIILVLLVATWATLLVMDKLRKNGSITYTANGTAVTELNKEQPEYDTVLPESKNITELGGWTRVSPSDRNAVFAYVDTIGTVQINVSEQPLPEAFDGDVENQIAYLAKGYHADVKIDAGGTAVYIGTSAKGPQSVIFTKNNLLILIKASAKIDNDSWAAYITTLK